jgi:hypothetical protein
MGLAAGFGSEGAATIRTPGLTGEKDLCHIKASIMGAYGALPAIERKEAVEMAIHDADMDDKRNQRYEGLDNAIVTALMIWQCQVKDADRHLNCA